MYYEINKLNWIGIIIWISIIIIVNIIIYIKDHNFIMVFILQAYVVIFLFYTQGWSWWGGDTPSQPNVLSRVGHKWSKPLILPSNLVIIGQKLHFVLILKKKIGTICLIMSYFVSIAHIMYHLDLFCLTKFYYPHVCYLWYISSWSMTFLVYQSLTKSIKNIFDLFLELE